MSAQTQTPTRSRLRLAVLGGIVALLILHGGVAMPARADAAAAPRGAVGPTSSAAAASDDEFDWFNEDGTVEIPPFGNGQCGAKKSAIWIGSTTLLSFLPGFTIFSLRGVATYLGMFGYYNKCVFPNGGEPALTVSVLMDELERASARQIDASFRANAERRASDLIQIVEREKANLQDIEALTDLERAHLASVLQSLGNDASQLEAELAPSPWEALPLVASVAALKNGAYVLAHELLPAGSYRKHLREEVIPQERAESVDLIGALERKLARFVVDELTIYRWSDVVGSRYSIETNAKRGSEVLYTKEWQCVDRWIQPGNQCAHFESRRTEFFDSSIAALNAARLAALSSLTSDYVGVKNALSTYRGVAFTLVNNTAAHGGVRKCLDVPGDGAQQVTGSGVRLWECESKAHDNVWPATSDQLWRFKLGTSQFQNVLSGRCLDVEGDPQHQVDGSRVVLATCATDEHAPGAEDQRWGMHPLGYLVNLASGRCLDLVGFATTASGAEGQVSGCEFGLSPNGPGKSGGPTFGTSEGLFHGQCSECPSDAFTDHVWSLRYRGQSLPGPYGMAAAPPAGLDTALPIAVDDHVTIEEDSGPVAVRPLANDLDPDGGAMRVDALTAPGHGTAVITGGGDDIDYRPERGYCNEDPIAVADQTPDDSFTYTLNGGASATVSVTVVCRDEPPVAVPDTVTVEKDAGPTAIDVLNNDSDVDGGPMRIMSVSDAGHGTVAVAGAGGRVDYTPQAGYCNDPGGTPDSFEYSLNGGSTAEVTVHVACPDEPPTAVDDDVKVGQDTAASAIDVLANDTDPDGGAMRIASVMDPGHGTATVIDDGTAVTYQPDARYCNDPGREPVDEFTYSLNGGSRAVVRVTVTCRSPLAGLFGGFQGLGGLLGGLGGRTN